MSPSPASAKFDGHRRRRLTPAEMAQIAGRAGRHQRDGTFGSLTLEGDALAAFRPEEIERDRGASLRAAGLPLLARERARFRKRRGAGPRRSSAGRCGARCAPRPRRSTSPSSSCSRAIPTSRRGRRRPATVRRLWAACGLPDFRKTGPEHHARLVARVFTHLSEGDGRIPQSWYAEQVARLDNVQGDIDTLADRIAGVRTWAYIAHRADWLADPAAMAERTIAVEERLSDALHERLTQRFVDRRTAVLMRDLGARARASFRC